MAASADASDGTGLVLHLAKSRDAIEQGRQAVLDYLEPFGLGAKVFNRIEVILEELVSNVIRHDAQATSLVVSAQFRDGAVKLTIEDDGAPFDPFDRPEPAPFSSLEEATLGGLGIPLVRRLAMSVDYQRISETNRVSATIAAE